ncbi:MAG TPA: HIT family protein [Anaerovoracaceae bacterium]|nr:HIT family protein [Anaerovoracaceae bacterium]
MYEIMQLPYSIVYFFRDQKNPGRCVVAYKEHYSELYEIPEADYLSYMKEVRAVSQAVSELYKPDKLNYAIYGDGVPHVHFHIVAKYKNGVTWGGPFSDKLPVVHLSEQEYASEIEKLRQRINKIMEV